MSARGMQLLVELDCCLKKEREALVEQIPGEP